MSDIFTGGVFKNDRWWNPIKKLESDFEGDTWWDPGKKLGKDGKEAGWKDLAKAGGSEYSGKPKPVGQASPPPILRSNIGVETARDDILKRQAMRQGQRNSVRAGETGGYRKSTILQKFGGND